MASGRCVICGVEGRGKRTFICESCGGPDRIVHFCTGCRTRTDLELEALDVVQRYTEKEIPRRPGVTLKVSDCRSCGGDHAPTQLAIFTLRPAALN